MLVQDLMPFTLSFWPFFFGHCLLSLFLLSCQGELQRSCSQTVAEKVSEQCQLACHCRSYPPLPPPPPPPPPPRLLWTTVFPPHSLFHPTPEMVNPLTIIVLGTVSCASVVFLLSAIIICYKAIKRLDVTIEILLPVLSFLLMCFLSYIVFSCIYQEYTSLTVFDL
uniref:Proline rich membrane anchor 1 n=1 Tax=Myripristis murdjan TaxID=586833 RepID=A0A667WH86_9TELE